MRKKLIKPIDDLAAEQFIANALVESEYDHKVRQATEDAKVFDSSQQACGQSPITAMLDGVRFHSKNDRVALRTKIELHVQREVAVARITADVNADKRIEKLNKTIRSLNHELERAHLRHVSDLIEAHGADRTYDGAECDKAVGLLR